MQAVVFDVDGTLVDSEQEGHRVAFNWAFGELGLGYSWDRGTYRRLLDIPGGVPRLRHYLESVGVEEGPAEALASRLHVLKTARLHQMIGEGLLPLRPGVADLLDDLRQAGVRLAVATTGSRRWVEPLLAKLCPGVFEVIVTGSDVDAIKPDPACYHVALAKLDQEPAEVLAVEDSPPGCAAALRAGLACLVVTNDDTAVSDGGAAADGGVAAAERFPGAALVVSGFGGPPVDKVVSDPLGVAPGLPLRAPDLAAVVAAVRQAAAPVRVP
jgi:HAD superfamily hydrolase (TIGR01509 family)